MITIDLTVLCVGFAICCGFILIILACLDSTLKETRIFRRLLNTPDDYFECIYNSKYVTYMQFTVKTHPDWTVSILDSDSAVVFNDQNRCIACSSNKLSKKLASKLLRIVYEDI